MSKNRREKYERRSVYLSSKEASLKNGKKYKNHWQAEYHHSLKRKKHSIKCMLCTGLAAGISRL